MQITVLRGTRESVEEMGMESLLDGEMLIQLPADDGQRVCDAYRQIYTVKLVEADVPEQVLVNCFDQIRGAWEQINPDEAHLAHCACGTWWFYWFSPKLEPTSALLLQGRVADLRASAADFIAAEFGALRGPTLDPAQEKEDWTLEIPGSSLSRT